MVCESIMKQIKYSNEEIQTNLIRFKEKTGYECNLQNPKTFCEKITRKKIYDRNPLIALTADKLKVRDFVVNIVGKSFKKHLTEILFTIEKYEYDFLPDIKYFYMLKPNNASGRLRLLSKKMKEGSKKRKIYKKIESWFTKPYGKEKLEWAYQDIKPVIFGEILIYENKTLPTVFRFKTFHGKVEYISIYKYQKEFKKGFVVDSITTYNRNFKMLDVKWKDKLIGNNKLSPFTEEMIESSEKICKGNFDYCRVDFMVNDSNYYLSELTHYPLSGAALIDPHEFDIEMGERLGKQDY